MKFNRILLKLSGESLAGEQKQGINTERLNDYARQIKEIAKDFGKSESDIRVLLHRTRLAFKTHLERQNVRL